MAKNKQNKRQMRGYRRLVIGLVVGIILFLIPFGFNAYLKYKTAPVVQAYQKQAKHFAPEYKAAKQYNREIVAFQQHFQRTLKPDYTKVQANGRKPVGYVEIPAIHLKNMMMYYGTSDWVLERGVGILDWGSLPIGGKNTSSIVTGHSGLANRVYFDNIRHLKKGDTIYVNAYGQKRAYAVTGHKVIDPKSQAAQRVMDVRQGQDRLTLLTCTPLFVNTHRLLVFAKRVPLHKAKAAPVKARDAFSLEHIWLAIVGLFLIVLLLWFWWINRRRRRA